MGAKNSASHSSIQPSQPPFQLASSIEPRSSFFQRQITVCDSILKDLRVQKVVLSDLTVQITQKHAEYIAWIQSTLPKDEELSLHSYETDSKPRNTHNQTSSDDHYITETVSLPMEHTPTSNRKESSAQQQPEVFEFKEVLGQAKKAAGVRYSSVSRMSREWNLTAEEIVGIEAQDAVRSNVLAQIAQLCDMEAVRAYDGESARLIVAAVIREKRVRDEECLRLHQRPPSFPDFLIYLLTKNPEQTEYIQHLAMFTKSIKSLYEKHLPEGVLYARLFHLFDSKPIGYQVAVTLPRLYERFETAVRKRVYMEEVELELGDEAWLSDVLELMYKEFESDEDTGEFLVRLLKPKAVDTKEYHKYLLLHKIALARLPLALLFPIHSAPVTTIARTLKRELTLWLSDSQLEDLLLLGDSDGDGYMNLKDAQLQFNSGFSSTDPRFSISCLDFLISLEATARDRMLRQARNLVKVLGPKDMILTMEEALVRVQKLCPLLDLDTVMSLYIEVKRWKEDVWTVDLVRMLLRYPPEGWGRSALVLSGLLAFKEGASAESLLADSGNILEEQDEED